MSHADDWTIRRLLQWTTDYLTECGSETPRLDGEILLANACDCERIELYTTYDEKAPDSVRDTFRSLVRERARGVPVAYLVGKREFYSLAFRVTPDVLIPRPETEHVVLSVLERSKNRAASETMRCIDVGTGSGVIAICVARYVENCHVLAVDISEAALEVAQSNVLTHGMQERVELLRSDLFEDVPQDAMFDIVVSNPPYVSEAELAEVSDEDNQLRTGGCLIFEISPMLEETARQIVNADGRFGPPVVNKDLAGHARVVEAARL